MAKILVVDDVADNVTLLTYDLEERGYEVLGAYSGPEALALAESDRPDAILLDVMMPVMDGIEVCRRLKEDPALAGIPVIMVTANSNDRDVVAGLELGADDYITKPFNIRILVARLEAVLRTKRAQDDVRRASARLQATNELLDARNKQLAEINETAYEFVSNVSHDFRTPLSVIKEFTSIISEGLSGPVTSQQQEHLGIIANSVDDLALMVGDMLDISKLEAGHLSVHRTNCRIDDIFERVQPALEGRAAASRVHLDIALDDELPDVYCDMPKIGRVIVNLAVNAIKFVGEGGHVGIVAHLDSELSQVSVHVTDDGPGIEPNKLRVIFERFKQVGTNVRASTKGVGLGLNIAKELVAMNFGQISVQTEPGKGSDFSFTLPCADPLKLLERYLNHSNSTRGDRKCASLITAEIENGCEGDDDVDTLLHDVLRSNDLVLRLGGSRWLITVDADSSNAGRIIRRIEEALEEDSKSRWNQNLPAVALKLRGTWQIPSELDQFMAQVQSELVISQETCV